MYTYMHVVDIGTQCIHGDLRLANHFRCYFIYVVAFRRNSDPWSLPPRTSYTLFIIYIFYCPFFGEKYGILILLTKFMYIIPHTSALAVVDEKKN